MQVKETTMKEKETILGMDLKSSMIVLEKGRLTLFFDEIGFKGNWLITALGPTVGAGLATLVAASWIFDC